MNIKKLKLVFVGGGINSAIGKTHEIALKMDNLFELVGEYFSRNPQFLIMKRH